MDNMNNTQELIPINHLGLDLSEPLAGWTALFAERGIEIVPDDLGRPSIPRAVLGELLAERREREARVAEEQRRRDEELARNQTPARGVPALEGSTPFESLIAGDPEFQTPRDEFGRPRPNFLDDMLSEGKR